MVNNDPTFVMLLMAIIDVEREILSCPRPVNDCSLCRLIIIFFNLLSLDDIEVIDEMN